MTPTRSTLRAATACLVVLAVGLLGGPAAASTDRYWDSLWGIRKVRADVAWSKGTGRGVTIAIVDSGVDPTHEDLRANIVAGYDVVDGDTDARDVDGHGTHVAGIAAAVANNGVGVAGVAPRAKIMPVRVCDTDGCSLNDVEAGVHWAVLHGADVVNLSLGGDFIVETLTGGTLTDAVNFAWSKGVIPVVAAGNDSLFRAQLRDAKALVVTATTTDDRQAPYATDIGFARWGIAAPGGTNADGKEGMIFSTYWSSDGDRYTHMMGTSMAAPHVAGAAALLRGMGLTPQETVDRLLDTAKDLGAAGDDSVFGHGRLDVAAAAQAGPGRSGDQGSDGSSAAGDAAPGAPGQSASGIAGGVASVRSRGGAAGQNAPSGEPTPVPTPKPTPATDVAAAEADEDGPSTLLYVLTGIGAFAAALGLGAYWLKRGRAA